MPPPARVLAAFGAVGVPEPLAGGTGRSWLAGSLVLKPLDCAEHEIRWQAELFAAVEQDGSRFAAPLPDVVDGWTAAPDQPSQLIHGDLTGNLLFHDELPPA